MRVPQGSWRTLLDNSAALQRVALGGNRVKKCQQSIHQRVRFARVVCTKIADIDVEGDRPLLGPSVDTQVGFRQQHRGSDSSGPMLRGRKRMNKLGDRLQPRCLHRLGAGAAQCVRVQQPMGRASAAMKVGSEVQSVHGGAL